MEVMRVATSSKPNAVAGAIAGCIENNEQVRLSCVGAGAINQAVKAVAIATHMLNESTPERKQRIVISPIFKTKIKSDRELTIINMDLEVI